MTDKKLTDNLSNNSPILSNSLSDNEIKKAFEEHLLDDRDCELCPYGPAHYRCDIELLNDALDLIKRLQAKNERLKKGWKADVILTANAKTEAYKEFAERLKDEKFKTPVDAYTDAYILGEEEIDNLLKELVGESL